MERLENLVQRALRHGARYAGYLVLVAVAWQLARLLVLPNAKSRRKRLGKSSPRAACPGGHTVGGKGETMH
jgi:hypothetical protein